MGFILVVILIHEALWLISLKGFILLNKSLTAWNLLQWRVFLVSISFFFYNCDLHSYLKL